MVDIQPRRYTVRNPSGIKIMLAMVVYCTIFVLNGIWDEKEHFMLRYFGMSLFCSCAAVLVWSLYRAFSKPRELRLEHDTIVIDGRIIGAEQIKAITSMGNSERPIIGIKPFGARIVPVSLCFKFEKNGEHGVAELANWAARNKVSVDYGFFFRWI